MNAKMKANLNVTATNATDASATIDPNRVAEELLKYLDGRSFCVIIDGRAVRVRIASESVERDP